MPPSTTAPEAITLRGGLTVSLPALQLAWSLEERGVQVTLSDDDGLVVRPRSQITPSDDQAIRQYRDELIALVRYVDQVVA